MAVCVHCSVPIKDLLISYGPDHVVCTKCHACGLFADPYVEQEAVIVAIDLILVKPRAYRHLLFNRPHLKIPHYDDRCDKTESTWHDNSSYRKQRLRSWWNLFLCLAALTLFDTYLRWYYLCSCQADQERELSQFQHTPTVSASKSYLRILRATFLQLATLFSTTSILSIIYCRILDFVEKKQIFNTIPARARFEPHLILTSLFLAHLTPIFLLSLLLIWHTNSPSISTKPGWQWDEDSIDWAIRSLVGGLSSGVALGVVLPLQKNKIGALIAIFILMTAWTLQLQVSTWLQIPFYSGVGVLQTTIGQVASKRYCY